MSLADYNNNPGNLRPPKGVTYDGQIGVDDKGFAIFENKSFGRDALVRDIQIKQKRGLNNPNDFLDVYAPASKENPEEGRQNYKMGLAGHLGLGSTKDPFPEGSHEKIADYISSFESGEANKAEKKDDNIPESFTRPPVAEQLKNEPETTTTTEKTTPEKPSLMDQAQQVKSYALQKAQENPDIVGLGGAGAAKGLLEKVFANPSANMMRQGETTPQQVDALKLKANELQTKLQETLTAAQERQASGQDVGALRQRAEQLHQENLAAQRELRQAQDSLRSLPRTPELPTAASGASPIEVAEPRPGRASGPKIEGDSGVRNWTIQEAGQKHQMPEAILDLATDKTKESPTGGKALINKDLENLQKIKDIGMGSSRLATTAGGAQLQLPDQEAARLEGELAQRQSQQAAEQTKIGRAHV